MKKVYHLDLDKKAISGAKLAFLPGDPARSRLIAENIADHYRGKIKELAFKREFSTYIASFGGKNVLVTSTGIGGPSAAIAIDELAQLGVETFIRVGTTGAILENIKTGDCIITSASVRLDGASTHYAPIEYPAVSDFGVVAALIEGAKRAKVRYHVGVTASSDTFYPGEGRGDSFRSYVIRTLKGSTEEWRNLHVLNYEMESATVLTMTASMGLRGGCVTGVLNMAAGAGIRERDLRLGEKNAIKAAVLSLEGILL